MMIHHLGAEYVLGATGEHAAVVSQVVVKDQERASLRPQAMQHTGRARLGIVLLGLFVECGRSTVTLIDVVQIQHEGHQAEVLTVAIETSVVVWQENTASGVPADAEARIQSVRAPQTWCNVWSDAMRQPVMWSRLDVDEVGRGPFEKYVSEVIAHDTDAVSDTDPCVAAAIFEPERLRLIYDVLTLLGGEEIVQHKRGAIGVKDIFPADDVWLMKLARGIWDT